jgi:hypothetical protein
MEGLTDAKLRDISCNSIEADRETGWPLQFHAHLLQLLFSETRPALLPGWHGGRSRAPMFVAFQGRRAVLALDASFFADA